jgi:membrane protein implicated in regulation of membrane protease activity
MNEVALGYSDEQVRVEAMRCLQCKKAPCVNGCPVRIRIRDFVCAIADVRLNVQILIFLVASLLGLILLRKYLKNRFFSRKDVETQDQLEEFIGHRAKAVIDFQDGLGKVEFKGTRWTARSTDDISKGQWVTIVSKDSLTLIVKSQK